MPIGWHAEHTSWRKPGSVSSLVRVPPPISSCAFEDQHRDAALRERNGRREPVRPGTDDDDVGISARMLPHHSGFRESARADCAGIMSAWTARRN